MSTENVYQAPESELEGADAPDLRYAGFWIRTGASIVDTILLVAVTAPILMALYGATYWTDESASHGILDILISYVFPAVAVILFWFYKAATPGKMLFGLRVISMGSTRKLSIGQSIGRYCAYFPSMIVLFLGIFWVAFDKRKQGWHDKLANTAVVRK